VIIDEAYHVCWILRIGSCGDTHWLVEGHVHMLGLWADLLAVDHHLIAGICALPQACPFTIYKDPSLLNESIGLPPGTHPAVGYEFIDVEQERGVKNEELRSLGSELPDGANVGV